MLNLIASAIFILIQILCSRWLGLTSLSTWIPLVIISLALVTRASVHLGARMHTALVMMSAIALWGPLFGTGISKVDAIVFAQAFAQFLLAVQSLELVRNRSNMDTNYLPGLGAITFVLLLLASDQTPGNRTMLQMTISFLVALVWALRPELPILFFGNSLMRHKANTLLMLLSGVWLIGSLADQQLKSQLPSLQHQVQAIRGIEIDMVTSTAFGSMTPLVDHVGLSGDVDEQLAGPESILFEVDGSHAPGYMRTMSFTQFDGNRWRNPWDGRNRLRAELQVIPVANQPPQAAATSFDFSSAQPWFALIKKPIDHRLRSFEVTVPLGRGALVPVPIGCEWIQCQLNSRTNALLLDVHGNVLPGSMHNQRYRVLASEVNDSNERLAESLSGPYLANLLEIPASERIWIDRLKSQVFHSSSRLDQKCRDVEQYFRDTFKYATENDIEIVRGKRTKLQTFVEDRKAAHCEYFAAASVLLLRSQSIPARLSTGYLVYELDNDEEHFAARKRNAHAWAEAYDQAAQRWRVVESTPGTVESIQRFATPQSRLAQSERQSADHVQSWLTTLISHAWDWCIAKVWSFFVWQHSWIIISLFVLSLLSYRTLRNTHRYDGRHYAKEVRRADRRALRLGYQRGLDETCNHFAGRLASDERAQAHELATWYLNYAKNRYRG